MHYPQANTMFWPMEKSGIYSVKSGYKLLCEPQNVEVSNQVEAESQKLFWKRIWRMNVPGKIKHFLWKACTNSLPTKENLVKRKILEESVCQRYLQGKRMSYMRFGDVIIYNLSSQLTLVGWTGHGCNLVPLSC